MNLPKKNYQIHTQPMLSHINVGFGSDISIKELATAVSQTVDYRGRIEFDVSKPDGTPRKWMDSTLLNNMGWRASVDLEHGLAMAYKDFLQKN